MITSAALTHSRIILAYPTKVALAFHWISQELNILPLSHAGYCWKSWRLKDTYLSVTAPHGSNSFPTGQSFDLQMNLLCTPCVLHFQLKLFQFIGGFAHIQSALLLRGWCS